MEFREFLVAGITDESEDVRSFSLAQPDGAVPQYRPGHFFLLRLPDGSGKVLQRSYSAASHPSEKTLCFCIKLKGIFTHLLWKLKMGDKIEASGPYGVFLLKPEDAERVFVGGGVGISALRSMILQTVKEGKKASLFHSAHTRSGLVYFDEMEKLAQQNANFKFFPSISGPEAPEGWGGLRERISVSTLKGALGTLGGKTFYLCGSKEMAGGLAVALASEGVPKERIKKDEWG